MPQRLVKSCEPWRNRNRNFYSVGGSNVKIANVYNHIVPGVCTAVRVWKMNKVLCNPSADVWVARK